MIGAGPWAQGVSSAEPVSEFGATQKGDGAKGRALMLGLFRRGVFLNPMGTKLYLSLAHTEADCDGLLDRLGDTLGEIPA